MHHSFWHYAAIAAVAIPIIIIVLAVIFWEEITSDGQNPFE